MALMHSTHTHVAFGRRTNRYASCWATSSRLQGYVQRDTCIQVHPPQVPSVFHGAPVVLYPR